MTRWFLLILVVLIAYWALMLAYLWQVPQPITPLGLLWQLLLLPILCVGVLLSLRWGYRRLQRVRAQRAVEQSSEDANANLTPATEKPEAPWLSVLSSVQLSGLGEQSHAVIAALREHQAAVLDTVLVDYHGLPVLSRRVDLEFELADLMDCASQSPDWDAAAMADQPLHWSDRLQRVAAFTQRVLMQARPQLVGLAQGFEQIQVWQQRPAQHQAATLHPAWQQSFDASNRTASSTHADLAVPSAQAPQQLTVLHLIPADFEAADRYLLQQIVASILHAQGIPQAAIVYQQNIVAHADDCLQRLCSAIHQLHQQTQAGCLLILGADSGMDQAWLEQYQLRPAASNVTLGESAAAVLLASPNTTCALDVWCELSRPMLAKRKKSITAVGQISSERLLETLQQVCETYQLNAEQLIDPEEETLFFSDAHSTAMQHVVELHQLIDQQFGRFPLQQLMMNGLVTEQPSTLAPLLGLAQVTQHVRRLEQGYSPLFSHAGEFWRATWLARAVSESPPVSLSSQSID